SATPRHARPAHWRGAGPPPPLRLRVLGAPDVERFFHVDYEYGASGPGEAAPKPTSRVGIIYRCNQWCSFCDLSEMDVKLSPETVKAAIDGSRARGSERLILTGGEPTLSPHLVEYVRHARSAGFSEIVLQTNAVRLSRGELVRELVDAGLAAAQVSIHGADAALSDRLTQAPGTHERTLRGIDNLVAAGVVCLLNHLVFRDNASGLVAFVELARARWGHRPDLVVLQFRAPRNEFERPEEARAHLAPYSAFVGPLLEARALARAYGFGTSALLDPTGVPSLCVLAAHGADVPAVAREHGAVHHHAWESSWFTRVEACRACGASGACQGVRRDYVEMFGAGEFAPLPAGAAGRADDGA
ncbi:MAG: radical SAM protein, partial [Deltaproteobacteria bacterium]|nr:radical SAM protein [Deltaproteobacteria bacterium]